VPAAPAAVNPAAKYLFTKLLKRGTSGIDVTKLQEYLAKDKNYLS